MEEIIIIPAIFLGLPWIIFHYITKWKTAATITNDDEALLEELYNLAKRLDERMDTVERLCDHIAIVSSGQVVRSGSVQELTHASTVRLEDIFIDAVGGSASQASDSLEWLGQT